MELQKCELFLVRYVPDPVKNEFVNIGVLMRAASEERAGETQVRFTRDWRRVRCLDPDVDVETFEGVESELRQRLNAAQEGNRPLLEVLLDSWSTNLQISGSMACYADNLATGMDRSMALFVEPRKREAVQRKSGRQLIYGELRTQFERAGVWDLMSKRIAAAKYTQAGDPLRIDCGYRPNGTIRMFHAVSLDGDLDAAKVLAFSAKAMREGVRRVERAKLELTAIIEPRAAWLDKLAGKSRAGKAGLNAAAEQDRDQEAAYDFALKTMGQQQITVMTTADLPRIADAARLALHI